MFFISLFEGTMTTIEIRTVGKIRCYAVENADVLETSIESITPHNDLNTWFLDPVMYREEINNLKDQAERIVSQHLPSCLVSDLRNFTALPHPKMLLVRQLPFQEPDKCHLAEVFLLGISALLSMKVFTYASEYNGRLMHHIKPSATEEYSKTALSSRRGVGLHVESAFDPDRPDCMALYCVTGDRHAKTTFYSLSALYSNLNPDLKHRLDTIGRTNEFLFPLPQSHSDGLQLSEGPLIFEHSTGETRTRYSSAFVEGSTIRSQELKADLESYFSSEKGCPDGHCLASGDLILWYNHTIMHGRTSYIPNYLSNAQRFLVRMYLSSDQSLPYARN